jgi:ammonium transporter, Amt family
MRSPWAVAFAILVIIALVGAVLPYESTQQGGGIVGMVATGVFVKDVGLIFGDPTVFLSHMKALLFVSAFTFAGSWLLYRITNLLIPVRVMPEQEQIGLDLSQHGEALG